jgi:hypothetical protein
MVLLPRKSKVPGEKMVLLLGKQKSVEEKLWFTTRA